MIQKILFTLSLCSLLLPLNGQIKGTVIDTESNPIPFANVAIYTLPDTTLITGTTTNEQGSFMLNTDNISSDALLRISFIGYETRTAPALPEQTISLQPDTTMLEEVVVEGDLPRIRLRNDAVVATVQNTVLSRAGTANDVLKRLPAITGDNGEFTIFGKGKAKIYVNNRELRDASELDLLSSADIKEVEIIHNPGSGYDASVKAVIRIHTVKKSGEGFSFDVRSTYFQSENTDLREQLNLNYRYKGLDIFGTVRYERYAHYQRSKIAQEAFVDTLWTQKNDLYADGVNTPLTTIGGINYEITPSHNVGIKYTVTSFPWEEGRKSTTLSDVFADGTFYDRWESNENQTQDNRPRHRLNVYYNGKIGELKVDFNSDLYRSSLSTASSITEKSQEYDNRIITSDNQIRNRLFATRLVLSYPLWDGQLQAGNEYTRTRRDDDYVTDIQEIASTFTSIHDDNNAFFAEYSRNTPIGQLSAGLRFEKVSSDYFDDGVKMEEQSRDYTHWFPSFSYGNSLGNVQLQLSYTTKTIRPAYWQLGSSIFYANRFTMQTGNPFLKPTIVHDATLSGSWRFLQLMVSYKQERDVIMQWATQMEENPAVTLLSTRNVDKLPGLTAFLTASPKFGIWSPQATVGIYKQWLTITSIGKQVRLNSPIPVASLNNSFSLPRGYLLTLDASFQGKGDDQNVELLDNQYRLDLGVTRSFLDDRLSVIVKGHDLFHGLTTNIKAYNDRLNIYQFNRWDSRQLELTVRYKFNTVKNRYKGTGAGEVEISRM
ncbi:outer membrane beta-barrel protein [Petrimonas mucosa]|uniref:outer membrane beta-barrel protein n=1 Tax=Petrimonas mucosa TaxID=1642646 RepID=UPI003BC8A778